MHLEVNQRLQEVASYKRDKYYPEEIDMALNKAMFRLLEQAVEKRFQDTQVTLPQVSALIVKNKVSDLYLPNETDPMYQEGVSLGYVYTPGNLYYLVNSRAEVITNPNNCEVAPSPNQAAKILYVSKLIFPKSTLPTGPYYANIVITSSTKGVLFTGAATGFTNKNSHYSAVDSILQALYPNNIDVYFERFNGVYTQNALYFVSTDDLGTLTMTQTGEANLVSTNSQLTKTTYLRSAITALTPKKVDYVPIKVHEADDLYSAQHHNNFYKTKAIEPSMDQTFEFFIIYTEKNFIVSRMYYDYIRKPKAINLALSQNCELAESVHPKIVDLAVEILRLDTKDPAYPQTVQDTELRTI